MSEEKPTRKIEEGKTMKGNLYEVSRSYYGREFANLQPVPFGYVPVKERIEAAKPVENEVMCIREFCDNRNNGRFVRTAVQNG